LIEALADSVVKAASLADCYARAGDINFHDRDRILLALAGGDHVKMAHVEASLAKARQSLLEKKASVTSVDAFTEYLSS